MICCRYKLNHGSPHEFVRFDFSKLRDGLGVFFTESREAAEYYARRGGRCPGGVVRRYRLTFRNVLRVRQGEEYTKWLARREGEKTERDVRNIPQPKAVREADALAGVRLIKAGYDGIRVEFHDGGAVEYVAFSNRNIRQMAEGE